MNNKRIFFSLFVFGVLILASAGYVLAQEQSPPLPDPEVASPSAVNDYISPAMSYQGRLVENGVPVDSTRSMTFHLYTVESGSAPIYGLDPMWSEGPKDVEVVNGLFNVVIGDTTELPRNYFGQDLWLEIEVGGTTLPRQKLYGAPYAFSLIPGARVTGNLGGGAVLLVENDGNGTGFWGRSDGGIGVKGESLGSRAGVYGTSYDGPGVEGSGDDGPAIHASGNGKITSTANSLVFVPAIQAVFHHTTDQGLFIRENHGQGYLKISGGTGGDAQLVFPVTLASVLYGRPASVEQVSLSFNSPNRNAKITRIQVYRSSMFGVYEPLMIDDDNDGVGWTTENDWYVIDFVPTTNNHFATGIGYLTVRVFCNIPPGENIFFSGVRVRLGHE